MPTLRIELPDQLLALLRKQGSVTLRLELPTRKGRRRRGGGQPRPGSHGAKVVAWAEKRGRPFKIKDVAKRFKLLPNHASMVLSKLVEGAAPIRRKSRGVYEHT